MRLSLPGRCLRALLTVLTAAGLGAAGAALGMCGPFTDVSDAGFCPFVLEIFTLGITTGTTPTTYDPGAGVTRLQMAAFLSRTVDGVLQRRSRRALVKKFWAPQNGQSLGLTALGGPTAFSAYAACDGADVWVSQYAGATVSRVRASDGRLQATWTGAGNAFEVLTAMGRVFVAGQTAPGRLYRIDPTQPAGNVTTVASNLGDNSHGITFDGARIWTANPSGSVSIVTPGASLPWSATTVTLGTSANGALFDGANVWVTSYAAGTLLKLDANGAILQTVTVGTQPVSPVFDGTNIWIPNFGNATVSVVRASTGAVLATLIGNGLSLPMAAAFDGQRVLVTNETSSVSLWKAADRTALGSFPTGNATSPHGACSDGFNFWIALAESNQLARF